eukprot:scaffold310574_cov62-Attheya_sp.AAC.1
MPDKRTWLEAIKADSDLTVIKTALKRKKALKKEDLSEKRYFGVWQDGMLDQNEDGLIVKYETPKSIGRLKQLCVKL